MILKQECRWYYKDCVVIPLSPPDKGLDQQALGLFLSIRNLGLWRIDAMFVGRLTTLWSSSGTSCSALPTLNLQLHACLFRCLAVASSNRSELLSFGSGAQVSAVAVKRPFTLQLDPCKDSAQGLRFLSILDRTIGRELWARSTSATHMIRSQSSFRATLPFEL